MCFPAKEFDGRATQGLAEGNNRNLVVCFIFPLAYRICQSLDRQDRDATESVAENNDDLTFDRHCVTVNSFK